MNTNISVKFHLKKCFIRGPISNVESINHPHFIYSNGYYTFKMVEKQIHIKPTTNKTCRRMKKYKIEYTEYR